MPTATSHAATSTSDRSLETASTGLRSLIPLNPEPTPKQLGYRLPAEWEPHEATWLSWPHKEASWPGKIETIFPVYAKMVAALARSETVHINVTNSEMEARARGFLDRAVAGGDIRFHHFPTNDAWCRDHGAVILNRDPTRAAGVSRLSSPAWRPTGTTTPGATNIPPTISTT